MFLFKFIHYALFSYNKVIYCPFTKKNLSFIAIYKMNKIYLVSTILPISQFQFFGINYVLNINHHVFLGHMKKESHYITLSIVFLLVIQFLFYKCQ